MSTDTGYNGWTNYPTWNVKLWIDNDEGSSNYWAGRALDALEDAGQDKEDASRAIASVLEEEYGEMMSEALPGEASTLHDLLGHALSSVNWDEIATSMIEDAAEGQS